jgi:antitoxin CptB
MAPGDGTDDTAIVRRKRLRFRAWHRGMREVDLLLGPFADARIDGLDEAALGAFEAILTIPDQELYGWIVGAAEIPRSEDTPMLRQIIDFNRSGGQRGQG